MKARNLCGRKRMMTKGEAKAQKKAREREKPWRPVKVYYCPKCHMFHTTTDYNRKGISEKTWEKLKND